MPKICSNCRYAFNQDDSRRCAVCGETFSETYSNQNSNQQSYDPHQTEEDQYVSLDRSNDNHVLNSGIHESIQNPLANNHSSLRAINGRIVLVERNDERPPSDFFSITSKILIFFLIVIPFITLFLLTGILCLSFALLGLSALSQLFNPLIWSTALFELFEIVVLSRIRGTDTFPVYRGKIEGEGGQESFFIIRGPLHSGNLVTGHDVNFSGVSRRGTFYIQSGRDLTTNADITSSYRNPWRVVFVILILIYGVLGYFIFNGYDQFIQLY